jgi:hypothetical protein
MACKDTDDDGAMHVRMRRLSGPRTDTDGQAYALCLATLSCRRTLSHRYPDQPTDRTNNLNTHTHAFDTCLSCLGASSGLDCQVQIPGMLCCIE